MWKHSLVFEMTLTTSLRVRFACLPHTRDATHSGCYGSSDKFKVIMNSSIELLI